jgi:hypothetical protein
MRKIMVALLATFACTSNANAETVRFICTNKEGAPDRVEVNFERSTALLFNKNDKGSIAPEEKSSPARITKASIRWPDILDGTTYSIELSTGVMKKLFESSPIYTKKCTKLPVGSNWQ